MDVCRLAHLQPQKVYGHPVADEWRELMPDFGWEKERTLPAIWFPYHLVRSSAQPLFDDTGGRFGPYAGQLLIGDQGNSLLVRASLERVAGVWQGACYPFWQGFNGGVNRLAFHDATLYLGFTDRGWGSVGARGEGLQRLRWSGRTPFDLLEVTATAAGFDLRFTKPLAPDVEMMPAAIYVREYGYRYHSTYGSDEFDSRRVDVHGVTIDPDRRSVRVATAPRATGKAFQIQIRAPIRSADGEPPITREAFYTLLRIPE
jgi:hypothetical protein